MTSHTWTAGRGVGRVELTDAARRCLEEYLAEVRSSLRHCRSVDVGDVERDVVEHIEHALGGAALAVDEGPLREVLRGLGSPAQWVPQEELGDGVGWLRRVGMALRSGPEDLRLGYLSFGIWCASAFLVASSFSFGTRLGSVLPLVLLGLVASFVLARASLAVPSGLSGAERWVIYPALVSVYAMVWVVILALPIVFAVLAWDLLHRGGLGISEQTRGWANDNPLMLMFHFSATFAALLWAILGFIAWRWPQTVREGLAPFAEQFRRRSFWLIGSVLCTIVFGAYSVLLVPRALGLRLGHEEKPVYFPTQAPVPVLRKAAAPH